MALRSRAIRVLVLSCVGGAAAIALAGPKAGAQQGFGAQTLTLTFTTMGSPDATVTYNLGGNAQQTPTAPFENPAGGVNPCPTTSTDCTWHWVTPGTSPPNPPIGHSALTVGVNAMFDVRVTTNFNVPAGGRVTVIRRVGRAPNDRPNEVICHIEPGGNNCMGNDVATQDYVDYYIHGCFPGIQGSIDTVLCIRAQQPFPNLTNRFDCNP